MFKSVFTAPGPKAVAAEVHDAGITSVAQPPSAEAPEPLAHGMGFWSDWKSPGLPAKFHCSPCPLVAEITFVPLKSLLKSCGYHGWPVCRVVIALIDQSSRMCAGDLIAGSV